MPGSITDLTRAKVSGFALHTYLRSYPVVVHVVLRTRILCSAIADLPSPSTRDEASSCWFNIALTEFELSGSDLRKLAFLVGETDELLETSRVVPQLQAKREAPTVIEDMIYANVRRDWITGATYVEAAAAGLSDADIIDLLYRDILGRPADPGGLAYYLYQRKQGASSLGDIRKSLLTSDEYVGRQKDAAWAPGAIFSNPITFLIAGAAVGRADSIVAYDEEEESGERQIPAVTRDDSENLEVELSVDSMLFESGWHDVEYVNGIAFRWMDRTAVIFSPKPEVPCLRISLNLGAVYGSHIPMVDCYLDDCLADVQVEKKEVGFLVVISPPTSHPAPYLKLRIESRVSGCPVQEGRGLDHRVLSLNVLSAIVAYTTSGSSTS